MNGELSRCQSDGLRKRLDEAVVLHETVLQLRKDLNEEEIPLPGTDHQAFERLRASVLGHMGAWERSEPSRFSRAINRVDLTERQVNDAMAQGGLPELAGRMVLRCLQKVLIRKRFAGLG
jgi:hypothetical protein